MKRKIYIFILSILSVITLTTAFIPIQSHHNKASDIDMETKILIHNGPESGYIEEIGD